MRTSFHQQPFGPNGAPQTFGQALAREVSSSGYRTLKICAAFASSGGTSRLYGPLRDFVRSGGVINVYVGLSNNITSCQAIEHLIRLGASVWGFDTGQTVLFHPKVYLLQDPARAWLAVGSSNLTSEGLYRNFETNILSQLDLTERSDSEHLQKVESWFSDLQSYSGNCFQLRIADLPTLVASEQLIDESINPPPQNFIVTRTTRGTTRSSCSGIKVPAAPPPHPELPGPRTRRRRRPQARPSAQAVTFAPAGAAQYFAMTMSAFDCSHRSSVPGTPEVSLPEDVVRFFPSVSRQGRQYPDAYFDVILNEPSGTGKIINLRIWQRPPGSGTGHADWRINVKHDIIDLTTPAGGDILLFERLPSGSNPPYEVWVVPPTHPNYAALHARCIHQVQASGKAGTKYYGLF